MAQNIFKELTNTTYQLPVFGSGADIALGAFMKRGPTPGTNNGELIPATGNNAAPDLIGRLGQFHDFSVDGDNLIAGTAFVTKPIHLAHRFRIFRLEYDQSDTMATTQAVNSTTITLTDLENNIDAAFLYVVGGTGIGQTNYLTASGAGSATLKAAFGTDLATSDTLIKILPRFHQTMSLNSDGTKIGTQAAVGTITVMTIDTHIERNGRVDQMDPVKHAALTGLNNVRSVKFYSDVAFANTIPYAID
jgi:hypothetical protein